MKITAVSIAFIIPAFSALPAGASGKEALAALQKRAGRAADERVIQMVGVRGQHQPSEWRVVVQEGTGPDAFHMYTVQGESVVKREVVQQDYRKQLPGAAIPRSAIRIDSEDAFAIADREARKAEVGFDSLNYELRCPELSSTPVWYVDLRDARDRMVGRVFVSAKDGEVLQRLWLPQPDELASGRDVAKEGKPEARRKGHLSESAPQQQPSLGPSDSVPEKKKPFEAIGRGMARIANPLRGKSEGQ